MPKPKYGDYAHIKKSQRKRPGKHAKNLNKRKPHSKYMRGQGR